MSAREDRCLPAMLACVVLRTRGDGRDDRSRPGGPGGPERDAGYPLGLFTSVTLLPKLPRAQPLRRRVPQLAGAEVQRGSGLAASRRSTGRSVRAGRLGRRGGAKAHSPRPGRSRNAPPCASRTAWARRSVGSIPAVRAADEGTGRQQRAVRVGARFPALPRPLRDGEVLAPDPGSEYGGEPANPFLIKGVPRGTWNHDRALDALGQVALEGYLPPGRVTARAAGRAVTGRCATAAATRWRASTCVCCAAAPPSRGRRRPPTAATASTHRGPAPTASRWRSRSPARAAARHARRPRRDRPRRLMPARARCLVALPPAVGSHARGRAAPRPHAGVRQLDRADGTPRAASTLGVTNVIRWEHVDQSCWDNSGADGKKSAERSSTSS